MYGSICEAVTEPKSIPRRLECPALVDEAAGCGVQDTFSVHHSYTEGRSFRIAALVEQITNCCPHLTLVSDLAPSCKPQTEFIDGGKSVHPAVLSCTIVYAI